MSLAKALAPIVFLVLGHSSAFGGFFDFSVVNNYITNANTNISGTGNVSLANSSVSGQLDFFNRPQASATSPTPSLLAGQSPPPITSRNNFPNTVAEESELERLRQLESGRDGNSDILRALRGYKALAKKGSLQGHIEVGRLLTDLQNPDADIEAYAQFSIAARAGYADGNAWMGWMHQVRRAPKSSPKIAFKLYANAAQNGSAWAMHQLGVAYQTGGLGVEHNIHAAINWYWKAARLYYGPSIVQLALIFDHGDEAYRDRVKAVRLFGLAARLNNPTALFYLALKHVNGNDVATDFSLAANYYERAANLGDSASQNNLANLYLNGQGVAQNLEKAVSWFRQSALHGNIYALYNLGSCYEMGRGVPMNLETAVYWYRLSATKGYEPAQYRLGLMHLRGVGVSKDVEQAISWLKKSAERNYSNANYFLAALYASGEDVKQDFAEAAKLFRLAVKQGNAAAMNDLAAFIEQKKIEPQIGEDTLDLYKRAADAADPTAMANYGTKLVFGIGMPVDIQQGITLLERARGAKAYHANVVLANIYTHPPVGVDRDLKKAYRYLFDAAPDYDEAVQALALLSTTNPDLFPTKDREKLVELLERVATSTNTERSKIAKMTLAVLLIQGTWKPDNSALPVSWLYDLSDSGDGDATGFLLLFYLIKNKGNPSIIDSVFRSDRVITLLTRVAHQPGLFKAFADIALDILRMPPDEVTSHIFFQKLERAAAAGDSLIVVIWAKYLSEAFPEEAAELLRFQISSGNIFATEALCEILQTYRVLPANAEELRTCS